METKKGKRKRKESDVLFPNSMAGDDDLRMQVLLVR